MKAIIADIYGVQIGMSFPYENIITFNQDPDDIKIADGTIIANPYDQPQIKYVVSGVRLDNHYIIILCEPFEDEKDKEITYTKKEVLNFIHAAGHIYKDLRNVPNTLVRKNIKEWFTSYMKSVEKSKRYLLDKDKK